MRRVRLQTAVLMFSLLFIAGCSGMSGGSGALTGSKLTDAQRFTLKGLNVDMVSLNDVLARRKVVLLNVWATWCGYCIEEMPDLVKLQEKFYNRGFTVLGVNQGESAGVVSRYIDKAGINFLVALDEETSVAQAYGLVGIPTSILVASNGEVLGEYHTFTEQLESDVAKAVEGENIHA